MSGLHVYIIPGFSEGKWHMQNLRTTLLQEGFVLTKNQHAADVIVTHSAGCYAPLYNRQALVVHIGPPHWPKKSLLLRCVQKVVIDFQHLTRQKKLLYFLQKTLSSTVNCITLSGRWFRLYAHYRIHNPLELFKNSVVIWNTGDTLCSRAHLASLAQRIYDLPGVHDDVWLNPKPYIAIIKSELEHRAKLLA